MFSSHQFTVIVIIFFLKGVYLIAYLWSSARQMFKIIWIILNLVIMFPDISTWSCSKYYCLGANILSCCTLFPFWLNRVAKNQKQNGKILHPFSFFLLSSSLFYFLSFLLPNIYCQLWVTHLSNLDFLSILLFYLVDFFL